MQFMVRHLYIIMNFQISILIRTIHKLLTNKFAEILVYRKKNYIMFSKKYFVSFLWNEKRENAWRKKYYGLKRLLSLMKRFKFLESFVILYTYKKKSLYRCNTRTNNFTPVSFPTVRIIWYKCAIRERGRTNWRRSRRAITPLKY